MKDTEPKQGVSKFTEKDLTPNSAHSFTEGSDIGPLETHVQSELEKIQAGHEGYKVVPIGLWDAVIDHLQEAQKIYNEDRRLIMSTVLGAIIKQCKNL